MPCTFTLLTEAGSDEKETDKQTPVEIVFVEGDKDAAFPGTLRRQQQQQQQNEKRDQQDANKDEKSGMSYPRLCFINHLVYRFQLLAVLFPGCVVLIVHL